MKEAPPYLSKKEQEEAEMYGGCDLEDYTSPDQQPYFEKNGHRQRSEANQPNHLKH